MSLSSLTAGAVRNGEFSDRRAADTRASGIFYKVDYHATNVTLGAFAGPEVGDADGDLDVDITDFNTLSGNFDPGGTTNEWTHADFDMDGDIDITDFNALSANFAPGGYGGPGDAPGQVPEPAALLLLLAGGVLTLHLCQRQR